MSIEYCEECGQKIDTDHDAEHFDECGFDEGGKVKLTDQMEMNGKGEWH